MAKQIIVAIGREYGSGGRIIAEQVAKNLELNFYDKNILDEIANEKNVHRDNLMRYDEKPKRVFLSRRFGSYSSSEEENVAHIQFEYIKKKAENGESFLIVGRCAEHILKYNPGLISIFISADESAKIERVMERMNLSEDEAVDLIRNEDKQRRMYHDQHATGKWADSKNYDLCINSSKLGDERTIQIIERYIRERMK